MADNSFQQMGGVPDFYTQLLNSANQQLVKLPDGSYAAFPQYAQPTTLKDLYAGRASPVPQSSGDNGSSWRNAQARLADPSWGAYQRGDSQIAQAVPDASGIPHASGTLVANKDQTRLSASPRGNAFAYGEQGVSAPVAAIGQLSPSRPMQTSALPMSERSPDDWWVQSWLQSKSMTPKPIVPAGMMSPAPGSSRVAAKIPLTQFKTVNPVSQIVPQLQSRFNQTPIGKLTQALQNYAPQQSTQQPGYNGTTQVTSDQLAGGNGSVFTTNTVLPDSMNNKRWLTGY